VATAVKSLNDWRKFQGVAHPEVEQPITPPGLNDGAGNALLLKALADDACSKP
jgi:hypothetical protein